LAAYLIPDIPGPIKVAKERSDYRASVALEGAPEDEDEELDSDELATKKEKRLAYAFFVVFRFFGIIKRN